MSKSLAFVLALSVVVGCARAPAASNPKSSGTAVEEPAAAPLAQAHERAPVAEAAPKHDARGAEAGAQEIPTECATSGAKICTPPVSFIARLCESNSADLALAMFGKSTPWTRVYLRRATEAWYTGSRRSSPVKLLLDEEVIVLASRGGGSSGVQISGSGSYDVYRWDGKCVSVMEGEVTLHRPPVPKSAPIVWNSLNIATQRSLLDDRAIKSRHEAEHDRCSRDSSAPRCTEATAALARLIADYVRKGGKLPNTMPGAR